MFREEPACHLSEGGQMADGGLDVNAIQDKFSILYSEWNAIQELVRQLIASGIGASAHCFGNWVHLAKDSH